MKINSLISHSIEISLSMVNLNQDPSVFILFIYMNDMSIHMSM